MELKNLTKFNVNDNVYMIKKAKIEKPCHVCNGDKIINYKGRELKCPECMGKGKILTNDSEYVVDDNYYNIRSIVMTINNDNELSIKYKLTYALQRMTKPESALFKTKKEAKKRCDELNIVRKNLNIDHIEIQERFTRFKPAREKIQRKLLYYVENKKFDKPIVVGSDGILRDGYVNYLVCKMLEVDTVEVVVDDAIKLV